jgi:phospholipid/cholesterol/gamma-HCH transport system substrate-binding protein
MPKRFSSAAIGMFVVGSIILIVAALAVLGSGSLFRKSHKFICFFTGSLNGLKLGAPVKARGVEIGTVAEIRLRPLPFEGQLKAAFRSFQALPVVIDIDESQLKSMGGTGEALKSEELNALIERGLRAQLATESLLTGLLYIELDLHPGTPANLMLVPGSGSYPEVPTIATGFQQIQETAMRALAKLDKVDVVKLTESITDAGAAAANLLNSSDLRRTLASLQASTKDLTKTLNSVRELVQNVNNRSGPALGSLKKAADQASLTLTQISSTATTLQASLAPDSPLTYRLEIALENFSEASSAIRELTDYLQRNPSAIVRGKYVAESHQ